MKKIIYSISILSLIFAGATSVMAVESASTTRQQIKETRGEIKDLKTAVQEKRQEIKDEVRKMSENKIGKMTDRYNATIDRLNNITTRVESRIEKIKNAGGDTSAATKYVADSKDYIAKAKAGMVSLKTATDTALSTVSSTTPSFKNLKELRTLTKEIEKNLQSAHTSLEKALGSLRGLSQIAPNASTTKTNN